MIWDGVKLTELNADEWFDVCRRFDPLLTREAFDEAWADFQARKQEGRLGPVH